jgi:hypothetical protein
MNNKTLLIILACVLLFIGIFKPNLGVVVPNNEIPSVKVVEPTNKELKEACLEVSKILQKGSSSDALRLSSLYSDLGDLISIDGEDEIIKSTEEIRQANRLSGLLLKLNIKGKYPDLAEATQKVIVIGMGDEDVSLDKDLRQKAVESFKALAWGCKEGSK